uniref:Flocculation protein FLO11-like n=1 Tax=Heterorhabditis bacteriophora TaxID=37862 RepID=A0A1I7WXB3_HETBA
MGAKQLLSCDKDCWTMSTRAALCAASLEDHIQRQMGTTSESTISQMTPSTVSPSTSNVLVEEENTAKPTESTIVTTNGNHSYQISTSELATQEKKTVDEKSQPTLQKTPSVSVDYTSLQPSTSPKPIPFSSPPYPVSEIHRKPEGASETKALPNGNASRSTASSPQTPTTTKISLRTLQEMVGVIFICSLSPYPASYHFPLIYAEDCVENA